MNNELRSRAHWLLWTVLLGACKPSADVPASQLMVVISADAEVAAALTRVRVRTYTELEQDEGSFTSEHEFALALANPANPANNQPRAGKVQLPFSFGVVRRQQQRVRLVVHGFTAQAQDDVPAIERKVLVSYVPRRSRTLEIALRARCFQPTHSCAALSETCDLLAPRQGNSAADATCGAVPDLGESDSGDALLFDAGTAEPAPVVMRERDPVADAGPPVAKRRSAAAGAGAAAMSGMMVNAGDDSSADGGAEPAMQGDQADEDAGVSLSFALCQVSATLCPNPAYPCIDTKPLGYTCQGQFAEWPMPDTAPGAKHAPSYDYTATAPGTVRDNVTGLTWQRYLPSRYLPCTGKDKVFGDRCTWQEAKTYCSQLALDGQGWRLPTKIELESLIGDPAQRLAYDPKAFPGDFGDPFWTASPAQGFPGWAWYVRYGVVATIMDSADATHLVRCVRSASPRGGLFPRYEVDEAKGTVTDTRTELVWQRGVHDETDWSKANAYCQQLGDGFRLPGLNELLTLVDPTLLEPALAPVFPDIPVSGLFWTAAQSLVTEGGHMAVLVTSGQAGDHDLTLRAQAQVRITSHVRCVR